jgi:hypothetical protein
MNKILKVFILLLSITILTSCFKNENSNEKKEDDGGIKVSVDNNQTKEDRKTKYDAENKVLKVGTSVEIKS